MTYWLKRYFHYFFSFLGIIFAFAGAVGPIILAIYFKSCWFLLLYIITVPSACVMIEILV